MNDDLKKFLTEKGITEEAFGKMEVSDLANTYNEYHAGLKTALDAAIEAKASKDDLEKMNVELKATVNENLAKVTTAVASMGMVLKKLTTEEVKYANLTFKEQIQKALEDNKDGLTKLKNNDISGSFNVKVGDMTFPLSIDPAEIPQSQRLPGVNPLARRQPFIQSIVSNGTANSNNISWIEYVNPDGSPGHTVEAATKNQIDFELTTGNENIKKFTAFIKVSDEMRDDIPFMASEINNDLTIRLALDVDDEVLNGTGGATSLNGIRTQQTAFSAGIFSLAVDNANLIDVLVVAMDNIAVANHVPSVIVLHPTDLTALQLIKVSELDQRYVTRLSEIGSNRSLDGVPIVTNTGMPIGNYTVMDASKVTVWTKQGMTLEVGMDGNDFTKNMSTIRIEWRGAVVIKANDKTAIVGGVIATDAALLETA